MNTVAVLCIGIAFGVVLTLGAVLWLDEQHMANEREA